MLLVAAIDTFKDKIYLTKFPRRFIVLHADMSHSAIQGTQKSKPTLTPLTGIGDFHVDLWENNGRGGIAVVGGRRGLGR